MPDTPQDVHVLLARKLRGYDVVSDQEIDVIQHIVSGAKVFETAQDLVKNDDRLSFSTVLVDGWAARYKMLQSGTRQITSLHVPGDFVDLHSFLLHKMDHGVVALSPCTVAMVTHASLQRVTETHPHLTRLLWLSTLVDAAIHRNWLVTMGRLPASEHLANLLCEIYLRLQVVGLATDFRFQVPLRQADVADTLGLSTVHANRTIQDLRARGLITWQARTLEILDWQGLVALGQFDSTYLSLMHEPR